jgi:hypothetical protein
MLLLNTFDWQAYKRICKKHTGDDEFFNFDLSMIKFKVFFLVFFGAGNTLIIQNT